MRRSLTEYLWSGLTGMAVLALGFTLGACSGSNETKDGQPRRRVPMPEIAESRQNLNLTPAVSDVKTVQLYAGEEDQLPILMLRGDQPLTLEFDLMGRNGRPLSVYFYHANREWERDLTPVEYLRSFQRDDLLDFTPSQATDVDYVHYTYRFPNSSIGFTISGNYILRVTEQGQEEDVLFERPFFVAEQAIGATMALDNVMVAGRGYPATVPLVRFTPPGDLATNVFDYSVCFVRNGQFERARCSEDAMLAAQPALQFYLEPEMAFPSEPAEYFLDLSSLYVSGQIEGTDFSVIPNAVTLEPDYAQFPGTPTAPLLNGQTVIEEVVDDVAEPDVSAQYAEVGFSFVPPNEQPLSGDLYVAGSFNDWRVDPANRMEWIPERGRYEGSVLLKQGQYEYRYVSSDRRLQSILEDAPPRLENLYVAFVYYSDLRLHTDRLLGVEGVVAR